METARYLIVPLLQAFFWFDDGLQAYLRSRGWDQVTRPQSMVMLNVVVGITRPSDIARNLGISRQAVHSTIAQMIEMGMLELKDDPEDGRSKVVAITAKGQAMRMDANAAVDALTAELGKRIGAGNIANLVKAFKADWGAPPQALDVAEASKPKPRGARRAARTV